MVQGLRSAPNPGADPPVSGGPSLRRRTLLLSYDLHGAAQRLRRTTVSATALALAALALPAAASAADNLGTGGVVIPGSALAVGVSGSSTRAGALEARFSGVDSPLFWGSDTSNMNDDTSAIFALNTPSGLYSAQQEVGIDNAPFTPTSAPVLTGTGTVGDPYVVTSQYDATAVIHVTQTITHVSGTTQFKATWSVLNNGGPTNMQAFEGADMYVNGNDNGTGTRSGSSPNRTIGSVASDGTQGQLVEQAVSPWNHYFSGDNMPFYDSTGDSTYGYLPDLIDPTVQDSGEGVEWDITVPANGTKTLSVVWNFTHPAAPQAPSITGGVPAGGTTTSATSQAPAFTIASGDGSNSISLQCSIDGGSWGTCTSPSAMSGLADGAHSFAVRALNSAADPGPATTRSWTVDATPPGAPALSGAPTGTVASPNASVTLTGETDATFRCSVDGGSFITCASPLALTGLADGNHTVSVKQVDAAGNAGTAVASASWTVDTSVPAATTPVTTPTDSTATNAEVAFTAPAGTTTQCSLDDAPFADCASPVSVRGLAVGAHTLRLRSVNTAGTAGAVKTVDWTVLAPVTEPTATTTATKATIPAATPTVTSAPAAQKTVCVSRRTLRVHWALPKGATAKGFTVTIHGKTYKKLAGSARSLQVSLKGRPAATVKVQVTSFGGKKALTTVRTYKTCSVTSTKSDLPTVVLR
jgi:hypothetical protein